MHLYVYEQDRYTVNICMFLSPVVRKYYISTLLLLFNKKGYRQTNEYNYIEDKLKLI